MGLKDGQSMQLRAKARVHPRNRSLWKRTRQVTTQNQKRALTVNEDERCTTPISCWKSRGGTVLDASSRRKAFNSHMACRGCGCAVKCCARFPVCIHVWADHRIVLLAIQSIQRLH